MQLFYSPNITTKSTEIIFSKEESRHIVKVMRKTEDDRLELTDGKGYFFTASLINADAKKCTAIIISAEKQRPLPYSLHLAVAPTKLNDRYEWFLEKATEIGVTEITPIICDHSERKVIKHERYNKIIQSAMKQSLKAYLPILNPAVSFQEFLASRRKEESKLIAHCENLKRQSIKSSLDPNKSTLIMIGPEGDFSKREISMAIAEEYIPISLGNSRLRTETAAIAACYSVYFNVIN